MKKEAQRKDFKCFIVVNLTKKKKKLKHNKQMYQIDK